MTTKTTENNEETQPATQPETGIPFEATVVSIIIRDFVHLTERLSPENLLDLMGSYYERIGLQVSQQQGEVTSISNHSMVVIFSGIEGAEYHARRAMRFALAIAMIARQTYFWIRQTFPELGFDKFGVGIGIHTGELIFAEYGIAPHMQRVASGHAVTIASLLSIKSKGLGWNIVCSEHAFNASGQGIKISQRGTVGAVWLSEPIDVVEIAVVRNHPDEATGHTPMPLHEEVSIDRTFPLLKSVKPFRSAAPDRPFIPGYQFLHPIGKGGISSVFLVKRLRDDQSLALKFFNGSVSEDSEFLCRFVDEYGLLEQITHNNVIRIYDQGVTDDALFIVLEYMAGGNLQQRIDSNSLNLDMAWGVLCDMTLALIEIHSHGIIHRDIKPDNIMFRTDGGAVLGDFGVAQQLHDLRRFPNPGMVVGTPYFISPEQAVGGTTSEQTDIYSLGAVFYNMLTGMKPYSGNNLKAIIDQHQHAPIPTLPEDYQHFQPLLNRMMAKNPEDRYLAQTLWEEIQTLENQYEPPPDELILIQKTSDQTDS